jgi:hypothetical protein
MSMKQIARGAGRQAVKVDVPVGGDCQVAILRVHGRRQRRPAMGRLQLSDQVRSGAE